MGSNKARTETIQSSAPACFDDASSAISDLRDELSNWYDNLPPQFQSGDKGEELQQAISDLDEVISNLDEASDVFPDIELDYTWVFRVPKKDTYPSRRRRMEEALGSVVGFIEKTQVMMNAEIPNGVREEFDEAVEYAESALQSAESVDFPTMF